MIAIEYCRTDAEEPRSTGLATSDSCVLVDRACKTYPHPRDTSTLAEPVLPSVAIGNPSAVERCMDQYAALAWNLARRYFAETADAEDAVQEAFVSLWQNAERFNPEVASEPTFVTMIFRRRIIDLVRKKHRPRPEANSPEAELAVDAPRSSGLEISEEVDRVREVMTNLREEEQRVLELGVCQGKSQTEIAEITGWPLGTVKSHGRRGMKKLREMLSEGGSR